MDLIDLTEAVRSRRRDLKLTLFALSEKSGVSRARIAALESGRISDIGFKNLLRVLHALNLDLRLTDLNRNRPTLEDLIKESAEENDPSLVRQKTSRKSRSV
jgi:transcriptional regulator with XRE-family HTH domain